GAGCRARRSWPARPCGGAGRGRGAGPRCRGPRRGPAAPPGPASARGRCRWAPRRWRRAAARRRPRARPCGAPGPARRAGKSCGFPVVPWPSGHLNFIGSFLVLQPCYLRDWEMQVHFKIHGQGKKNLNGDGFAIWYTKDRMQPGPVFGSKDNFLGLGVFVDTYPNEEKQQEAQKRRYSPGNQRVFPYISAMVNNGSLTYDHDRDGRPTELGGCTAMVRNLNHDTFLVIRYVKRRLTVMIDIDGKHEWRDCIDVPGVRLPRGYYFGTSSVTGDLSDNHDIISLKLYQLTVERTPEEEKRDREVFLPVVDNLKLPGMEAPLEPMSGLALFLIVFFSLVAVVFAIVIGVIVYNKWQEQSRKHFY
uniref:Lectin, mannose binding 2 like n=2 Tax=Apteryx TaxID=8821 RepID=A0A8B9PK98_APTOW